MRRRWLDGNGIKRKGLLTEKEQSEERRLGQILLLADEQQMESLSKRFVAFLALLEVYQAESLYSLLTYVLLIPPLHLQKPLQSLRLLSLNASSRSKSARKGPQLASHASMAMNQLC